MDWGSWIGGLVVDCVDWWIGGLGSHLDL